MADNDPSDLQVLITAQQAFPAFERAVLFAKRDITGSFRIFDLSTRLRSPEGRRVGETWFDLLADALSRGVRIDLTLSDFDPVMATDLHRLTWRTMRQAAALAEVTGASQDQLRVRAALHPALAGALPRMAFLPLVLRRFFLQRAALTHGTLQREAPRLRQFRLPHLHTVSHHQKVAVIDDDVAYVGGLDLNERRYDTLDHARPAEDTWSDVQLLVRNTEVAQELRAHLDGFLEQVSGQVAPPGALRHLSRTLSVPRRMQFPFLSPRTVLSEIEQDHLMAFRTARHLLHIETQYLRASRIAEALAEAGQSNPELTLVLILPAAPEEAAFVSDPDLDARYGMALERRALEIIRDGFGARATIASPVRPVIAPTPDRASHCGAPIIYVHNKVLVRDDDWALVGSANLNGRSLAWDTEVAQRLTDKRHVTQLRRALFRHWWGAAVPEGSNDPTRLQPVWSDQITRNTHLPPPDRMGFLVNHDGALHGAEGVPLPGVTEDVV